MLFNKSAPSPGFLCTSSAIALDKKICTFADGLKKACFLEQELLNLRSCEKVTLYCTSPYLTFNFEVVYISFTSYGCYIYGSDEQCFNIPLNKVYRLISTGSLRYKGFSFKLV